MTDVLQAGNDPDPDRDGNPGNNSVQMLITLAPLVIPTLGSGALLATILLLALFGRREQPIAKNILRALDGVEQNPW